MTLPRLTAKRQREVVERFRKQGFVLARHAPRGLLCARLEHGQVATVRFVTWREAESWIHGFEWARDIFDDTDGFEDTDGSPGC